MPDDYCLQFTLNAFKIIKSFPLIETYNFVTGEITAEFPVQCGSTENCLWAFIAKAKLARSV